MSNQFDQLKKLDELSEMRDVAEEHHKPLYDAKIAYLLKKMHGEEDEPKIVIQKRDGKDR